MDALLEKLSMSENSGQLPCSQLDIADRSA